MHRRWITVVAVIAMLWITDAGEAQERPPYQTPEAPPLPYRLDGMTDAPPPGHVAPKAPAAPIAPAAQIAQPSAESVRDGYYYPPPVTVTTVIEYRRR